MALTMDENPLRRITRGIARGRSDEPESITKAVGNKITTPLLVSPSPKPIQLFAINPAQYEFFSHAAAEFPDARFHVQAVHNGHQNQGRAADKRTLDRAQAAHERHKKSTSRVRSGIRAPDAATINIHLWHPDSGTLVNDFRIRTKESKESNVKRILAPFGMTSANLFFQDNDSMVTNIRSVKDGQTLVVASSPVEDRSLCARYRFIFYAGEELPGIAEPLEGQELWTRYAESKRRDHIGSLARDNPETRNYLRITEPYLVTKRNVDAVRNATAMQLETNYTPDASKEKIYHNWGVHFALFFPHSMRSPVALGQYEADEKILALLAILAKATPGQSRIVKEILVDLKGTDGCLGEVKEIWVIKAIDLIYRNAKLIVGDGLLAGTGLS
jgi:hypothetical protein